MNDDFKLVDKSEGSLSMSKNNSSSQMGNNSFFTPRAPPASLISLSKAEMLKQ
jgi:hypothetical protein